MYKFSKTLTLVIIFALAGLFTTCKDENPVDEMMKETVFYNGNIYTVNPAQSQASALYVKDGIIEYVGEDNEAKNRASGNATMIDLEGAFMMPGIHDVHLHPLEAATDNFHFILDDEISNAELYGEDVAAALEDNPDADWLLGWGHWIDVLLEASRMPKVILDEVAQERPVAIMEQTSHSIWCNSKALELMGITENTPDPPGGIIMREDDGEANGLLIDNAGNMLLEIALAPTPESAENDYNGLIEFALPELAKYGITSICDARTYWKREHHLTWQRIADEELLTVRVNAGLWAYPGEADEDQIEMLKSLYKNDANSLLKFNQIKLYADGIIHNTTAAMHDDYTIDYFGLPTNNGLNYFSQERLASYINQLEVIGFDFHIHAIGNRGVHEALNAIEEAGTVQGRHRLTHVEYVDSEDISRFAALNVTADAQVAGDFTKPEHWHDNDYLIGPALNEKIIPLKSLFEAGARITLSSDWDVSALNPFVGLHNAVTRSPEELGLEEAIKAYTINAAYVMRQEDVTGTIEVGKMADLIILDRDIFNIPVENIKDTKVVETYLAGEQIYQQ